MVEILSLTNFLHDRLSANNLPESELEQVVIRFRAEAARYKQEIFAMVTSGAPSMMQPEYLHAVTGALESLSDQIYRGHMEVVGKTKVSSAASFFLLISAELTEMLNLLRHIAPRIFDQDHKVTYSQVVLLEKDVSKTAKSLRQLQKQLDSHTAELIPILLNLLEEHAIYGITYRRFEYLQMLLASLSRLPTVKTRDYNFLLHYQLIMLNFNHPDYIHFCNGKLDEKYSKLSPEDKLREFRTYDMNLSRILTSKDIAFDQYLPSTKDALHVYVKAGIEFLFPEDQAATDIKKIHTDFTVAQLGLFGKIARQSGVLTESSMSGLYRLLSQYFTARGTDSISPESIQSKGNSATPETKVSMINIMLKWIELIRAS